MDTKKRCFGDEHPDYITYHDCEWGVPSFDDQYLFEMLILEGAQAGLSWLTVLKKRLGYRQAFHDFDVNKVAHMSDQALIDLRQQPAIIRHQGKITATRDNARIFINMQQQYDGFAKYLWSYVDGQPIINHWQHAHEVPVSTPLSDTIAKDLKKRGMRFVGSTIVYAYMQAVGLVNDHLTSCWRHPDNACSHS